MTAELSPRLARILVAVAAMALMILAGLSLQVSRSEGSGLSVSGTAVAGAQGPQAKLVAQREPAPEPRSPWRRGGPRDQRP